MNNKVKTTSIVLSLILAIATLLGIMPTVAATAEQRTAIQLVGTNKTGGIASKDYVYYGNWANDGAAESSPLRWIVLDTKTNMDGATEGDGLFLLSEVLLGDSSENGGVYYQRGYATFFTWYNDEGVYCGAYFKDHAHEYLLNEWQSSDAQKWCRDFSGQSGDQKEYKYGEFTNGVPTAFSAAEAGAIIETYKTDKGYRSDEHDYPFGEWTDTWEKDPAEIPNILSGDKVFFLSAEEAETYFPKGYEGNEARAAEGAGDEIWWLRSPASHNDILAGHVRTTGAIKADEQMGQVGYDWAARPAFNMDLGAVLFTSAADNSGHNNVFSAPAVYNGNEWKLTLRDRNDFSDNAAVYGTTTLNLGYDATELTITHAALSSLSEDYTDVTAMLTDANENVLYCGSINRDPSATSSTVTIPAGLATGTYTLSVYGEEWNGAGMTDYATGTPFTTEINVVCHHTFADNANGFCIDCGAGEEPLRNTDGCYEIGNAGQLYWFAAHVNEGNTNANARLTAHITVNENVLLRGALNADATVVERFRAWTPIGNDENQYVGNFDGQNFTVSGLYFHDSTKGDIALFGYLGHGGTAQRIGVIHSYFSGDHNVGGIVGYNQGDVSSCYAANLVSGASSVGGVVGDNNQGTVTNCYNTGAVSGGYVGGVVGNNSGTVENCHNTGAVNGSASYTGGVAGNNSGTLTDCYNTGTITTGISSYTGGVAGRNYGAVTKCYNTGLISGASSVGGVVGDNNQGTVTNCYNTGDISCVFDGAGVVGGNNGAVTNCYNVGAVRSERDVGGVVKYNYGTGTVQNCYFLKTETVNAELNAIFEDVGEATDVAEKTAEQLASGEVAYLLGNAFGQTLTGEHKDGYPILGGAPVYYGFTCNEAQTEMIYTNLSIASSTRPDHDMADATCTVPSTCTRADCGHTEGTVNADAHVWNEGAVTTDPTCTEKGVKTFTCLHNGAHTYTEDVNALGHTEEPVAGKAATCAETGLTDGTKCRDCGEIFTAQTEIPALGHKYDSACDADCNTCGEERTPAEHADADHDGKCDACDGSMGTANSAPSEPSTPSEPADPAPSDGNGGLGTGAIVGIVIGSVAVVGTGGFAIFWFVIKKKTWADLLAIFKKK